MTLKNCTCCKKEKPLIEFNKNKNNKDGYRYECIKCGNLKNNEYKKTKDGLTAKIYGHQKQSSRKRNHELPNYTLDELREWAFSQPIFHKLFDAWVDSGYNTKLRPSFDRTDDYQGYSLDRLQIMTWQENRNKSHADMKSGINNKQSKSVSQITKEGVSIKKYHSAMQAERETGISNSHIVNCCKGKLKSAGGFKWEYSEG